MKPIAAAAAAPIYLPDTIKSLLAFAWITTIPIEDSWLQGTALHFGGASLCVLPLALLAAFLVVELPLRGAISRAAALRALEIALYVVLVTVAYLLFYQGDYPGDFLALKALKVGILVLLFVAGPLAVPWLNPRVVRYAIYAALLVCLLGVLLGDVLRWQEIARYFHFTRNLNGRPRGLATESTTLGVQVITLGLMAAAVTSSRWLRVAAVAIIIVVVAYCQSKGGAVGLVAALVVAGLIAPGQGRDSAWRLLTRLWRFLLPIGLVLVGGAAMIQALSRSLYAYTSITTRLTTVVTALWIAATNPLGTGLGGMLPAFNRYLPRAIDFLGHLHIVSNFAEVLAYIGSTTGRDVDTKSFFFNLLIYFGLPFAWLFTRFHLRLFKALRVWSASYWLIAATAFCLIALTCYNSGLGSYDIPLVYGVALASIKASYEAGQGVASGPALEAADSSSPR